MVFLILIIAILSFLFLYLNNIKGDGVNENLELFSTEEFKEKSHIKSAKCPQCGKIAETYDAVKEKFGLRKVGYATDIQSWCRECRRDKDNDLEDKPTKEDLNLFNE